MRLPPTERVSLFWTHFRTAGFPQYGFKASLSGRACPADITVKPAPGMPAPSASLPRPFARFRDGNMAWLCVQVDPRLHVPLRERPVPLYPRGPWLRAEFCCLGPSSRTPTPSAGLAGTRGFHGPAVSTQRLRCAGAPRRPARPSLLSLPRCGALCAPTPPSEAPCHPRFSRRPSLAAAGSQARGANGKSPLVGTCTRPVRDK